MLFCHYKSGFQNNRLHIGFPRYGKIFLGTYIGFWIQDMKILYRISENYAQNVQNLKGNLRKQV